MPRYVCNLYATLGVDDEEKFNTENISGPSDQTEDIVKRVLTENINKLAGDSFRQFDYVLFEVDEVTEDEDN